MVQGSKSRRCWVLSTLARRFGVGALIAVSATACGLVLGLDDPRVIGSPVDGGTGDSESSVTPDPEKDAGGADVLADTINAPCDPIKQDCVDPSLRCTIVFVGGEHVTGCQPPWEPATNQEGEVCSFTPAHEDCVKGLHCLPEGVTATSCHKICAKDSECGPGGRCGTITTVPPYYGVCWKTCTPFSAECAGATCAGVHSDVDDQVTLFEACREIGSGALGTSCAAQFDCAANLNCQGAQPDGGFKCTAMCDDTHPCNSGTCKISAGLPNNGGVCH